MGDEPVRRRSVAVFPVHRGPPAKVLLLHRIPARGGFWQPVTGSVEDQRGETLEAAAARELEEETGLTPTAVEDLGLVSTFTGYDGVHYTERAFVAFVDATDVRLSEEHDDGRFVPIEEGERFLRWEENVEALRRIRAEHLEDRPHGP